MPAILTLLEPLVKVVSGGGIENIGSLGANEPKSPGSNDPLRGGTSGAPIIPPSRYWQPLNTNAAATKRPTTAVRTRYRPLYACRPLNQSDPEYVTRTIPNPTTSSSAAGRPAHERWLRAWR